jgi:hypothetical protein
MRKISCILLVLAVSFSDGHAGWKDDVSLSGYFRETPIVWDQARLYIASSGSQYTLDNLLHCRQNLKWYAFDNVTLGLELKERVCAGKDAALFVDGISYVPRPPYFGWTRRFVDDKDLLVEGTIDRLWAELAWKSAELTVGRQRIAWGTNLVWNPTDIFNPSSPLDFDNEEKPGTDAARLQLYMGPNSSAEIAVAPGRDADSTTAAVRIKVNRWRYDWIMIAGRRASEGVAGFSWAGSIAGGAFRGELLFASPRSTGSNWKNVYLTGSVSGDYTFSSSLYLQGSVLYYERGTTGKAGGEKLLQSFMRGNLTPGRASVFGEVAKDLSPLWRADLVGILNPNDKSFYIGPSLRWSAVTNLDLTFLGLLFGGDDGTEFGDESTMIMLWGKYSY